MTDGALLSPATVTAAAHPECTRNPSAARISIRPRALYRLRPRYDESRERAILFRRYPRLSAPAGVQSERRAAVDARRGLELERATSRRGSARVRGDRNHRPAL